MLTATRLGRRFGARLAVEDVSFRLAAGEVLALLGPNGAGKTTTLRMLAGLIAPTTGEIHVDGERLDRHSAPHLRRRIGLLTEAPGLWDRLTVRENLTVYARLYGLADPASRVSGMLGQFGLGDREHERAAQLSKGLKQRVALARTLLHDPAIVLLDEPTSGLDPESARQVRDLVISLRDRGHALLLSTHNLHEVERVADRVAILNTRLIAVDTPSALRAQLFGRRVRVMLTQPASTFRDIVLAAGSPDVIAHDRELSIGVADGESRTPVLVEALVRAGAGIVSVVREEAALEDVYLRLVEPGVGP